MPAYPERESSMVNKIKAKEKFVTDKTWTQAKHTRKKRVSIDQSSAVQPHSVESTGMTYPRARLVAPTHMFYVNCRIVW